MAIIPTVFCGIIAIVHIPESLSGTKGAKFMSIGTSALVANILVLILEARGLYISISARKWQVLAYYTQLSNIVTAIASVCLLCFGAGSFTAGFRYLSTCMLTMTFLITLFVLVPMGGGFRKLMLSGNGLYHHTLCPAVSVTSYILWEQHNTILIVPILVTLVYGIIMLLMNYYRKFDGPYPFFRVHNQSRTATAIWVLVLLAIITVISLAVANAAH